MRDYCRRKERGMGITVQAKGEKIAMSGMEIKAAREKKTPRVERPAKALRRMLEKMSIYILDGEGYSTVKRTGGPLTMKTNGILNSGLIEVMARMGHGDMLVVTDWGFPFPLHDLTKVVDLSAVKHLPRFLEVLKPIVDDFEIEEAIIANETKTVSPEV
jgi:hypothetical protein